MLNWLKSQLSKTPEPTRNDVQPKEPEPREVELAYGIQIPATSGASDNFHLFSRFLSSKVIHFQTMAALEHGQELHLKLPCGTEVLTFVGQVAWLEEDGHTLWGTVSLSQSSKAFELQRHLLDLEASQRSRAS